MGGGPFSPGYNPPDTQPHDIPMGASLQKSRQYHCSIKDAWFVRSKPGRLQVSFRNAAEGRTGIRI